MDVRFCVKSPGVYDVFREEKDERVGDKLLQLDSPAFVLDHARIAVDARRFQRFATESGCRVLFSLKSQGLQDALLAINPFVDGFSASSLFEARHARDIGGSGVLISYVSAVVRSYDLEELIATCNHMTLNSLSQLDRYKDRLFARCEVGMRLNPGISLADDVRYDPCGPDSRLGVPLVRLRDILVMSPDRLASVTGLHFHSNCDSDNSQQLISTIHRIESIFGDNLRRFRWLNVGGGYSFRDEHRLDEVAAEFRRISEQYGLQLIMEPGAAIVRSAGSLISTVEDIVEGSEYPTAILDTTVNHWPEVFEYEFEPDVVGHVDDRQYTYRLAGCSCLAGDLFGIYSFNEPLEVGSRVVFRDAGAYSIVKAHMFNGINLPNIYSLTEAGELVLLKRFTYEDFASRCGVDARAVV